MSVPNYKFTSSLKEAHIENEEKKEQEFWKQLPGKEGEERAEILIELAKQAIYQDHYLITYIRNDGDSVSRQTPSSAS